jgi:hypothetical protein
VFLLFSSPNITTPHVCLAFGVNWIAMYTMSPWLEDAAKMPASSFDDPSLLLSLSKHSDTILMSRLWVSKKSHTSLWLAWLGEIAANIDNVD